VHHGGPQGPVRRRVQRGGVDATRVLPHPAAGLLRQPQHRRDRQRPGGPHRRDLRPRPALADRLRPLLCPVHARRRRCRRTRDAGGEDRMSGSSTTIPWLTILGLVPLVGAVVLMLLPRGGVLPKQVALGFSALALVVAIIIAAKYDTNGGFQFVEQHEWIKSFGAHYALGVDGLGLR